MDEIALSVKTHRSPGERRVAIAIDARPSRTGHAKPEPDLRQGLVDLASRSRSGGQSVRHIDPQSFSQPRRL
jgi:hypothetical protein